eukprot:scaffold117815_cov15-Tisochrysis_lutea.AAC.1
MKPVCWFILFSIPQWLAEGVFDAKAPLGKFSAARQPSAGKQACAAHLHCELRLGPLPCTTLSECATTSPRLIGTKAARSPPPTRARSARGTSASACCAASSSWVWARTVHVGRNRTGWARCTRLPLIAGIVAEERAMHGGRTEALTGNPVVKFYVGTGPAHSLLLYPQALCLAFHSSLLHPYKDERN